MALNREQRRNIERIDVMPVRSLLLSFPELGEVEFRFDMEAFLTAISEQPEILGALDADGDQISTPNMRKMVGTLLYCGCRCDRPDLTEAMILSNLPPDVGLLNKVMEFFTSSMPQIDLSTNPTKARRSIFQSKRKSTGTGSIFSRKRK